MLTETELNLAEARERWQDERQRLATLQRPMARLQLPKHQTATAVELFVQCITDALRKGDKVELRGFGSFQIRHRRPHTGATVHVPAKNIPWFTPGKVLQALLNPQALLRGKRASTRRPSPAMPGRDARGHTAAESQ